MAINTQKNLEMRGAPRSKSEKNRREKKSRERKAEGKSSERN